MNIFACALLLAAGPAGDEDDGPLGRQARALIQKLHPEGASGRLAEAARTEGGRRALEEALEDVVRWKTRSYEEDFDTHYEAHFFTADAHGMLTLRPERREEISRLTARLEETKKLFDHFNQRADALAGMIDETTDLGRSVRAQWLSAEDRLARFHEVASEIEEDEDLTASAAMDAYFDDLEQRGFEKRGDRLHAKADAFAGEDGEAPQDVSEQATERRNGFREARRPFQDVAERCDDAAVTALFDAPIATYVLDRHRDELRRELVRAAQETALDAFTRRYLTGTGETLAWRSDRLLKAEQILDRAREIQKEIDEEKQAEKGDDADDDAESNP